jgi:hypothetical protein
MAITTNYLFFDFFQPAALPLGFREPTDAHCHCIFDLFFLGHFGFSSEYIYDFIPFPISFFGIFFYFFFLHICHAPSLYKTMSLGVDCAQPWAVCCAQNYSS